MGHAARRQREHDVFDAAQAALALLHDGRLERAGPVTRHVDLDRPALRRHRLRPDAVTRVPVGRATLFVFVIAEVAGDLAFERGLDDEFGQLGQQAVLPVDGDPVLTCLTDELGDQLLVDTRAWGSSSGHGFLGLLTRGQAGQGCLYSHRVTP